MKEERENDLSFYEWIARRRWPRSYHGKFFLIAFVGTHVPLIGAVGYVLWAAAPFGATWPILGVLLAATLLGTAGTMAGLYLLLRPLARTAGALRRYAEDGALPTLPTGYDDQAGRLMRDTQHTMERLDGLARFRDHLLGIVAHDLRSPATSVLLATDALDDFLDSSTSNRDDSAEGRELVAAIRRATQRQLAFSKTLLEQMHRDTARLDVRPETVQPETLLEEAAEGSRLAATAREVTIDVDVDPEAIAFHTDPRLAGQVLENLVSNAVAFSPPGGTVVLQATRRGAQIAFDVRDEGPGMSADEMKTLFEPFQQGSARRERGPSSLGDGAPASHAPDVPERGGDLDSEDGSAAVASAGASGGGLGLWIARTLTRLLGGTIEVDSTPGEGTTFRFMLPTGDGEAAGGAHEH